MNTSSTSSSGRTRRGLRAKVLLCSVLCAAGLLLGPLHTARAAELLGRVDIAEMTPETETAISRALAWLARTQNANGSWGGAHQPGVTALTLMAFMVQGHFPDYPPYGDQLSKGVDFLLATAKEGGGYMGVGQPEGMYDHGLATLALSEVWGMSKRDDIRDALKQAVEIIIRAQSPKGGWRYSPQPQTGDVSVTVTQIVALASAQEAGILVPDRVLKRATDFVKTLYIKGHGFLYAVGYNSNFARTACGTTALLIGGERDAVETRDALRNLGRRDPWWYQAYDKTPPKAYYYGNFYAIQAVYQAGDQYYHSWYAKIRDELLKTQQPDGRWSKLDIYGTATPLAVLILGVPYRFLPIYQR